jgi:hexosaminidase
MKKERLILLGCLLMLMPWLLNSCQQKAGEPVVSIIPKPVSLTRQQGSFTVNADTKLVLAGSNLEPSADFLNNYLEKYYGFRLQVQDVKDNPDIGGANTITLNYGNMPHAAEGAYHLEVKPNQVEINGGTAPGVFYGIQTLIQLLPVTPGSSLPIACVKIDDYPRFSYRGMMLDCGRHFFDTAFVKKFIDFLALHKMNTFHWHLTEDQGWRIEIKKYPRLTEVGAWRDSTLIGHYSDTPRKFDHRRSGGFYTQEEIKDIVAYAKARYITVIPEIEMPGHSMAAIAAYPELACQPGPYHVGNVWGVYDTILCPTPYTFNFYENVLTEVMALFPSHYIHIGGDEAPKVTWNNSAFCRNLMKKLHLANADELQSYFINHMEKFLNAHGREIIGWDEILQGGLAPHATVMSWRGEQGGIAAAKMHHDVIMSPTTYVYLDYYQSKAHDSLCIGGYLPLEKVYSYNPVPKEFDSTEASYIKGVQANLWTEYIPWPTKVEYQIFPRMEAVAEIGWTPQDERHYPDFVNRVQTQFSRYDLWKVSYSRAVFELDAQSKERSDHQGVDFTLDTKSQTGIVRYTTNGEAPGPQADPYKTPLHLTADTRIRAALFSEGKRSGPEIDQQLIVNRATGKKVKLAKAPAEKYSYGGAFTLVDGEWPDQAGQGSKWLGWNGGDMEATIDLGATDTLHTVTILCANAPSMWVYPPREVSVSVSADGNQFQEVGKKALSAGVAKDTLRLQVPLEGVTARYLKVKAINYGTIPQGAAGAGNPPWLFIGEIGAR